MAAPAAPKTCFVIAPIGAAGSEIRARSDKLFKHIIEPVADKLGYKALRADHINESGLITHQIINYVIDSDLVIADLAYRNPNVFYELAIRHAKRKSVILLQAKGEAIPFDVAGMRAIDIDLQDLDSVEDAKRQMDEQIKAAQTKGASAPNPISTAIDLKGVLDGHDPTQKAIQEILSSVQEMKTQLQKMDSSVRIGANRQSAQSLTTPTIPLDYLDYWSKLLAPIRPGDPLTTAPQFHERCTVCKAEIPATNSELRKRGLCPIHAMAPK